MEISLYIGEVDYIEKIDGERERERERGRKREATRNE